MIKEIVFQRYDEPETDCAVFIIKIPYSLLFKPTPAVTTIMAILNKFVEMAK